MSNTSNMPLMQFIITFIGTAKRLEKFWHALNGFAVILGESLQTTRRQDIEVLILISPALSAYTYKSDPKHCRNFQRFLSCVAYSI